MPAPLAVDNQSEVREIRPVPPSQPRAVKIAATLISYVFHPVFIPVYIMLFLVYVDPYMFVSFGGFQKTKAIIMTVMLFTFFPVVSTLLLRALNFIKSIELKTQQERIIPLIVCGIFYFWVWYVWRNLPEPPYPRETVVMAMAVFLSSSASLMMNIYMKVSLHAVSMGVLLAFGFWLVLLANPAAGLFLVLAALVTGLVCTSRFIVSDHTAMELYGGLMVGMMSIPVAAFFN